ncbi:unnamed protein product [Heligmosomoides polygyrus]|uniref:Uncharacterized protein n=1 Tax=Heligmosomoides polygyrus TaxID=6339 RepID=A0A183F7J9_HELPZ|nr:unnamed protein product [Heligmosomoides polygyrus]
MKVLSLLLALLAYFQVTNAIRLAILPPVDIQNRWKVSFPNRLSRFTDEVPRRFVRDDRKIYPASFWFRG